MIAQDLSPIGQHPKFLKALEYASNVAVTKAPILIVGESGVGKKFLAKMIHKKSSRSENKFHIVDCSLDDRDVEALILGKRDPETGKFNRGVLETGNGGTVVLANIDALEENFQKRLFTILQELSDYELDVRIMATTTKNLSKYVGSGRFYRALYTYFTSSPIQLMPLRERSTDIPLLVSHFLGEMCEASNKAMMTMNSEALEKVVSYYWTHNVKELKSVLEKTVATVHGETILATDLAFGTHTEEKSETQQEDGGLILMSLKDAERLLIKKALIHTSENRTQAAKILGVSIRTLRNKINEYRGEGSNYFVNLR